MSLTPYLREILRAYTDPEVEEITICSSTQVGKTTAGIVPVLYSLAVDPWNALYVMPRDDDAYELNVERFQSIIEESPTLWALFEGQSAGSRRASLSRKRIIGNGMVVKFSGAQSPAALASRGIRTLVADELDKWPAWSGNEADPVELARERLRTYWNRKGIFTSTPTDQRSYIVRELAKSTNEKYHVPCPHCGEYQPFEWTTSSTGPGIHWPKDVHIGEIRTRRLAWYECRACGERILDQHKPEMLRRGVWCPASCRVEGGRVVGTRPARGHVGYHLWAAYSPWLTFGAIAAKFLESKDDPPKLQNFVNSWLAQIWRTTVHEVKAADIRSRRSPYAMGSAPEEAWTLTAGVDVQSSGERTQLFYAIRAWGPEGASWLVKCGFAEGWEAVVQALFRSTYRDSRGNPIPLHLVLVDSGYRTDEVYEFCRLTSSWASKGASHKMKRPWDTTKIMQHGETVSLVVFDPDYYKARLHRLVHSKDWHIPTDVPGEYFDHMVAEQQIEERDKRSGRARLVWKVVPEGAANHYFDCEVLCSVGADILDLWNLSEEPREIEAPAPVAEDREGVAVEPSFISGAINTMQGGF